MAKVKTRELILEVALLLFNERGERLVNSVDLANEMNISPGNLYYHFKGKEEVVEELYARFHASLFVVIESISTTDDMDAQSLLAYLCLISEIFVKYCFITQDLVGLCAHYQKIEPLVEKALRRMHTQILALISRLPAISAKHIDNAHQLLADNVLNTLLHADVYDSILNAEGASCKDNNNVIQDRLHLQLLPFLSQS